MSEFKNGQRVEFTLPNGQESFGVVEIQKWPNGIGDIMTVVDTPGGYSWNFDMITKLRLATSEEK